MAEVIRYINTGSTPGGNGTTNETTGANRAYASMNEWEAAEQTDLVAAGNTHKVYCEGTIADTTACTIGGWTTGVGNGITVTVDVAVRHKAVYSTSYYRIETTNAGSMIFIGNTDVVFEGIQLQLTATVSGRGGIQAYADRVYVRKCLVKGIISGAGVDGCRGIHTYNAGMDIYVYDNIVYDFVNTDDDSQEQRAFSFRTSTISACYNNTAVNCYYGFWTNDAGITYKNNIAQDSGNAGYAGTPHADSTNNLSDKADAVGSNPINSKTLVFRNKVNDDFHLAASDTDAIGAAENVSTDPDGKLSFSDDIDGDTRVTWDVGADECIAVVGNGMSMKSYWGDV